MNYMPQHVFQLVADALNEQKLGRERLEDSGPRPFLQGERWRLPESPSVVVVEELKKRGAQGTPR